MAVTVIDTLKPKNDGTFPIAEANDVKGGYMQVADLTARGNIAAARRVEGMRVFVQSERTTYRLAADLTTWIGPGDTPRFKPGLAAQSNSGTSAYPSSSDFAIAERNTFISSAAADYDSVRMWGSADDGYPGSAVGLDGQVKNLTDYIVNLYPVSGLTMFFGASEISYIEIAPAQTVFWLVDDNGDLHITT